METRAYPMVSPGVVPTVAFEAPSPGSFAGGSYGNPSFAGSRNFLGFVFLLSGVPVVDHLSGIYVGRLVTTRPIRSHL